jgi:hypothetical protein
MRPWNEFIYASTLIIMPEDPLHAIDRLRDMQKEYGRNNVQFGPFWDEETGIISRTSMHIGMYLHETLRKRRVHGTPPARPWEERPDLEHAYKVTSDPWYEALDANRWPPVDMRAKWHGSTPTTSGEK